MRLTDEQLESLLTELDAKFEAILALTADEEVAHRACEGLFAIGEARGRMEATR